MTHKTWSKRFTILRRTVLELFLTIPLILYIDYTPLEIQCNIIFENKRITYRRNNGANYYNILKYVTTNVRFTSDSPLGCSVPRNIRRISILCVSQRPQLTNDLLMCMCLCVYVNYRVFCFNSRRVGHEPICISGTLFVCFRTWTDSSLLISRLDCR